MKLLNRIKNFLNEEFNILEYDIVFFPKNSHKEIQGFIEFLLKKHKKIMEHSRLESIMQDNKRKDIGIRFNDRDINYGYKDTYVGTSYKKVEWANIKNKIGSPSKNLRQLNFDESLSESKKKRKRKRAPKGFRAFGAWGGWYNHDHQVGGPIDGDSGDSGGGEGGGE